MTSSSKDTSQPAASDRSPTAAEEMDAITLHILSPSSEVVGGRITFPSIPLDTKIGHLKSRIQNSITNITALPERQRLIYRGRPLLNMDLILRQVLQSDLYTSTGEHPTYTIHLVIMNGSGPTQNVAPPSSQNHAPESRPAPEPAPQSPPQLAAPHQHQPHLQWPQYNMAVHAQAAQHVLQNQLLQVQQQMVASNMMAQAPRPGQAPSQGQGLGQSHVFNQLPHLPPPFPGAPQLPPALQAAQQQQQGGRGASTNGIHNPGMNPAPPGVTSGQTPQGFGPITTRVHETVSPDGRRTRVVVNETMFQLSRQPTPTPTSNPAEAQPAVEDAANASNAPNPPNLTGPRLPPITSDLSPPHDPPRDDAPPLQGPTSPASAPPLPSFVRSDSHSQSTVPLHAPLPAQNHDATPTATTAFLVSGPNGPQALVFAPDHGLFTNASAASMSSARAPRIHRAPRLRPQPRFQQTPSGHIRAQNRPVIPAVPVVDHRPAAAATTANPQQALQQVQEAVAQARNAAARQDPAVNANANLHANNEILRNVMSRIWTFIKLYFVIFIFTEPGTWFRWGSLFAAAFVAVMPSTTRFRGLAARVQARVDDLLVPIPPPAQPVRQRAAAEDPRTPNRAANGPANHAPDENNQTRTRGPAEPDPATTAARLVQEHQQRHPNPLRDGLERVERAIGLFIASLIPGVGERQVRVREEARRERERVAAEQEEEERSRQTQAEEGTQEGEKEIQGEGSASESPSKEPEKGKGKGKEKDVEVAESPTGTANANEKAIAGSSGTT